MQISELSASNTFSATDVLAIEVNVNGVEKTYKLTGATLAAALASIGSYLKTTDVVNNLTSTATTQPLSAAQGKALNDQIAKTEVTNLLTNVSSSVDYLKAYKTGNVVQISFQVKAGITNSSVLFNLPSSIQPSYNTVFGLYRGPDGKPNSEGAIWIESSARDKVKYYGNTISAASYTTIMYIT